MRLTPAPIRYEDLTGFQGTDLFQRQGFGEALGSLIMQSDEPLVLSLEAPWGEGKTTFVHQWRRHMEKTQGVHCIYFDAFRSDFHSDAFLTLATELYRYAAEVLPQEDPNVEGLKKGAIKLCKVLSKSAVRTALKMVPLGELADETATTFAEELQAQLSEASDTWLEETFSEHVKIDDLLERFQDTLANVVESAYHKISEAENTKEKPLVFIIDELDRCRPDFALQLLEKVKHVFSVPRVTFLLVNNPDQLEESVRATYGAGIDANRYLHKFFTISMLLPINKQDEYRSKSDLSKYTQFLTEQLGDSLPNRREHEVAIAAICSHKGVGLREIERIVGYVIAYAAMKPGDSAVVSPVAWARSFACCVKVLSPRLFRKMMIDDVSIDDINEFIGAEKLPDDGSFICSLYELAFWMYTEETEGLTDAQKAVLEHWNNHMRRELITMPSNKASFRMRVITPLGYLR